MWCGQGGPPRPQLLQLPLPRCPYGEFACMHECVLLELQRCRVIIAVANFSYSGSVYVWPRPS